MINKHPILQKYATEAQRFFEKLPTEEIERMNQEHMDSSDIEYREFKNQLEEGVCYLCGEKIKILLRISHACIGSCVRPDLIRNTFILFMKGSIFSLRIFFTMDCQLGYSCWKYQ